MGDEASPAKGSPINLTPSGKITTNWQTMATIVATIIGCTVVVVGGLFTIRHDIADARREAKESGDAIKAVRDDVFRLRIQLGVFDNVSSAPANTRSAQP